MKLPRDVSGTKLAQLLHRFGYTVTRQVGSHMRLTTTVQGEHHVTIPAHRDLRAGTLEFILSMVAEHLGMARQELAVVLLAETR